MLKLPTVHLRDAMRDPGLLVALAAELLGTLLFQLLGASAYDDPLRVAFTFAAIVYAIKYISGGHLNPAVSLAAAGSGHVDWTRGILYTVVQLLGAILGAMLQVGLVPGSAFGHQSPGCSAPSEGARADKAFGWELLLTFLFVTVVYASVMVRPGHGDASPLAAGLALYACLATGGQYTGYSSLNPARTLATSLIFGCYWRYAGVYLLAQLLGLTAASLLALAVYGRGPHYTGERPATEALREALLVGGMEAAPLGPGAAEAAAAAGMQQQGGYA